MGAAARRDAAHAAVGTGLGGRAHSHGTEITPALVGPRC